MEVAVSVTDNDKDMPPWSLESDLKGEATVLDFKTFIQRAQWMIAEEVLKEEQGQGFDKKPRVRTDNKWGKNPREVKFFGKIEYFSRQNIGEALLAAYEMVRARSPVVTGQYLASHYVYVNQKIVATSKGELAIWLKANERVLKDGDLVRIINVTPYASRIEIRGLSRGTRGKSKGKTINRMKNAFGSGAYALAARAINARFKAAGRVRFQMMPNGFGGVHIQPTGHFRTSYISDVIRGRKNKRKRFSGPYVFPSIAFKISGEGITQ